MTIVTLAYEFMKQFTTLGPHMATIPSNHYWPQDRKNQSIQHPLYRKFGGPSYTMFLLLVSMLSFHPVVSLMTCFFFWEWAMFGTTNQQGMLRDGEYFPRNDLLIVCDCCQSCSLIQTLSCFSLYTLDMILLVM